MEIKRVNAQSSFAMRIESIDYEEIGKLGSPTIERLKSALTVLVHKYDDTISLGIGVRDVVSTKTKLMPKIPRPFDFKEEIKEKVLSLILKTEQEIIFPKFIQDDKSFLSKPKKEFLKEKYPGYKQDNFSLSGTFSENAINETYKNETDKLFVEEFVEKVDKMFQSNEIQRPRKEYEEQFAILSQNDLGKKVNDFKKFCESLGKTKYKKIDGEFNKSWF